MTIQYIRPSPHKFRGLALLLTTILICNFNLNPQKISKKSEEKERQSLLKKYSDKISSAHLSYLYSFPNEKLKDVFLKNAHYMCRDPFGYIYVIDSEQNKIFKFDDKGNFIRSIGNSGQGPGEFQNPTLCTIYKNKHLLVNDLGNRRLQFFDFSGNFIKTVRVFKSYISFVSDDSGLIYANPASWGNFSDLNLIEVLDENGGLLYSFGDRILFKNQSPVLNNVKLSFNLKAELYVAWEFLPIIRLYSKKGALISEVKIDHPIINEMAKFNYKAASKRNHNMFRLVSLNIIAKNDGLYLLRYYPRIEVLDFNTSGKLKKAYWSPPIANHICADFILDDIENPKRIYILDGRPENRISIYKIKKRRFE